MYSIDIQSPEFMKYLERGEREAFQQLFETYHKALCFFAARIVRDHSEAEDIVQDVFLSFWKMDRGGFPNVKTIKTFLYNSVQHRCLNYLRDLEIRDRNYKNLNKEELDETIFFVSKFELMWWRNFLMRLMSYRIDARKSLSVHTWMAKRNGRLPKS